MKKILLIVGVLVLVGGAFAAGMLAPFGKADAAEATAVAEKASDKSDKAAPSSLSTVSYSTKERVMNLADAGGLRYVKTEIVIELQLSAKEAAELKPGETYKKKSEQVAEELYHLSPKINDAIVSAVSTKRSADLMTIDGRNALRTELKDKFTAIIHEWPVKNVYFAQLVIQ
jgi:flagellar FliL protein